MALTTITIPDGLDTRMFVLGEGVLDELPELLKTCFPDCTPWIVADCNTWRVAGDRAQQLLIAAGLSPAEPMLFPAVPRLHPDYALSKQIADAMPPSCVPVAVGSGVINDLVKCACGIAGNVRYCCVPTACSVDGYTSTGAAMSVDGFKKTIPCPPPYALCADTAILKTAPADMFAAGYADLLAKIPGGADWYIADALGVEPIREDVWTLIQKNIRRWTADSTNMQAVFDGLAATGYAMQMYKDSRPASGAEHLASHVWEMEGLAFNGEDVSHGFKVAIGSIGSTTLMSYIIKHDWATIQQRAMPSPSREERECEIDGLLSRGCYGEGPRVVAMEKFLTGEQAQKRRALIGQQWDAIRRRLNEQLLPLETLKEKLAQAGCPTSYADIGLSHEAYVHGFQTAQLIRKRYTSLDLLYEAGVFADALATL